MGNVITSLVFIPPPPTNIQSRDQLTYVNTKHHAIPVLYLQGRKQPPEQVIIFSHGNAEDLGGVEGWLYELSNICEADVVGYDYPGYGYSNGLDGGPASPSEKATYEAINAVYEHVTKHIPENKIILFGRSLGTGPTVDLASRKPGILQLRTCVKGVVLQSPLLSAVRVVMRSYFTLPFDVFANVDKIKRVKAPVFICHGDVDTVINISHGKKLSEMLPNKYPPLFLAGAGHNDIETNFYQPYSRALKTFVNALNTPK